MAGPVQCLLFGLLAVLIKRWRCSPAPLVLAFVLGPRLETHLLQSLLSQWPLFLTASGIACRNLDMSFRHDCLNNQ